ncbi:MAG: cytochrome c [Anaerolineae bacterium]
MTVRLTWLLITLSVPLLTLVTCANPQPLPVAPTPIPTLIPATLPPQPTATLRPAALGVTFPSRRPSGRVAGELYQQNCANCHGINGTGAVPGARDLSDADYLRGETPLRFYQIISDGRGSMPGWQEQLSADERWDLAFYIWHFATSAEILGRGEAIYQQNCATCHGSNGKGVVPDTADFTNVEWMAVRAPTDFFQVVTEGRGTMPSWQGRLSPAERWAAIEYLRTFAYEPPTSPRTAMLTEASPTPSPTEEPTATPVPSTATPTPEAAATSEAEAAPPAGEAADGERLFADTGCVACHGAAGEGGLGPKLVGVEKSDAELFAAINSGIPGTAMMPFGDRLSDEEIRDLIAFIREL